MPSDKPRSTGPTPLLSNGDAGHADELMRHLAQASDLICIVAFAKVSGWRLIESIVAERAARGLNASFVVGLDFYQSEPAVLRAILALKSKAAASGGSITLHVGRERGPTLHPKVYWLRTGRRQILIVGSATIQIARARTDLIVIATASRPETQDWVRELGAHHVLDHSKPLAPQIAAAGLDAPDFVFSTTHTDRHLADIAELIAPQGRFALIDDPASLDIVPFKRKAVSVHRELMFTRSLFDTPDVAEQGRLLDAVAELVDTGAIRTTATDTLSPINAANLIEAHRRIESATTRGKIVLEGWQDENN